MLAIGLFTIGVFSRLILHTSNFTPILALALFGGLYFGKRFALIFALTLFIISDLIIGFHPTIIFTWSSIVLIVLIGFKLQNKKGPKAILLASGASAVVFYILTNFGVWLVTDMYTKDLSGLLQSYLMALPFFRFTLLSTVVYAFVLIYGYEFLAVRIRKTRFSSALL